MTNKKLAIAKKIVRMLIDAECINLLDETRSIEEVERVLNGYSINIWQVDKVIEECSFKGVPLSLEISREILAAFEDKACDEFGLNSDSLSVTIFDWFKGQKWKILSDDQRAKFDQGTCAWAVSNNSGDPETDVLSRHNSLLDAVTFARKRFESAPKKALNVFACSLGAADLSWISRLSQKELLENGYLVWSSEPEEKQ